MGKQKLHTLNNVLGLAIGLSFTILIYLFVSDELSFDRFHEKGNRIYRVLSAFHELDGSVRSMGPSSPLAIGPLIQESFSEVKEMARLSRAAGVLRYGDKLFRELIYFTDPGFFQMFSFPLISGNADRVLKERESIVIIETVAQKYFGTDQSCVGIGGSDDAGAQCVHEFLNSPRRSVCPAQLSSFITEKNKITLFLMIQLAFYFCFT